MIEENNGVYVGVWDGIAKAVRTDRKDKETAKDIAKWIREGATIERCTVAQVREGLVFDKPWPPQAALSAARGDGV